MQNQLSAAGQSFQHQPRAFPQLFCGSLYFAKFTFSEIIAISFQDLPSNAWIGMAFSSVSLELAEPLSAMWVCCLFSCAVSVVQTVPDLCEGFWLPHWNFTVRGGSPENFVECFFIIATIIGNIFLLLDFGVGL